MDLQEISVQLQAGKAKILKQPVPQAIDAGIPPSGFWTKVCWQASTSSVPSSKKPGPCTRSAGCRPCHDEICVLLWIISFPGDRLHKSPPGNS